MTCSIKDVEIVFSDALPTIFELILQLPLEMTDNDVAVKMIRQGVIYGMTDLNVASISLSDISLILGEG
ncbi:hypothetical protein WT27_07730 [Burkholderia territorii]|uniref:Uncharacterized protein n=1 Tax=Burkholderia territorii TaxID=1503055 RepID=A0A119ARY9_9BURK|nr:hypothetical protein WT27_07730 [Burkholderia territorii]KVX32071.1 hypothetical protein WT31_01110 [Burkholderia territorii]